MPGHRRSLRLTSYTSDQHNNLNLYVQMRVAAAALVVRLRFIDETQSPTSGLCVCVSVFWLCHARMCERR